MKLSRITLAAALLSLAVCTTVSTTNPDGTVTNTVVPIDQTKTQLAVATHNDLLAAAAYATRGCPVAAGAPAPQGQCLPAVASVYTAQDGLLTAVENQITACNAAIAANMPQLAPPPAGAGPILIFEIAREAVGNFAGIAPAVKLACEPITLPTLPVLPKP